MLCLETVTSQHRTTTKNTKKTNETGGIKTTLYTKRIQNVYNVVCTLIPGGVQDVLVKLNISPTSIVYSIFILEWLYLQYYALRFFISVVFIYLHYAYRLHICSVQQQGSGV